MALLQQFLRLADGLAPTSTLALPAVAERLCCSERNARLLLGRMQAEGWLRWTPGRGRGRLSELALLVEPAALRERQWRELIGQGRLEAAFHALPPAARARLRAALPAFLGAAPGGGLRMPFYRPLHALDPVHVSRRTEAHLVAQVCDGLTAFDRERDAVVPALAHHWESADGGRRWRLRLRPGLRFHDGRPVRAADAVASLLRLRDTRGPHHAVMAHLEHARGDGADIELVLSAPDHLLPNRLAHHAAAVLPEGDWRRPGFAQAPIGTGAFRLVRNNEHRATFAAFEDYWRERALLDEIELWVVPTHSALPAVDLRLGQLAADRATADWRRLEQAEHGCDLVLLNPARPAFATAAARMATGRWLRAHVAQRALPAGKRLASGWLPAFRHLETPPRAALAAAPARLPGRLRLVTYEHDDHVALARCVAEAFARAGTRVDVEVLPAPEFATLAWRDHADLAITGEVLGDDLEFGQLAALAGEAQFHAWLPPGLARWLAARCRAISAEPVRAERLRLMEEAFARVTQAGAVLPMRHTLQQLEHAPHLGGVSLARCGWMDFRKLWLAAPPASASPRGRSPASAARARRA